MQATMKRETSNVIRRSTALVHIMKASTLEIKKNIYLYCVSWKNSQRYRVWTTQGIVMMNFGIFLVFLEYIIPIRALKMFNSN